MARVRFGAAGFVLALLNNAVQAAAGGGQPPLPPEKAADMIIAAVVKGDPASLHRLSVYWQASNSQPLDFSGAPYVGDNLTPALTHNLQGRFTSADEPDSSRKEQAVIAFAHAVALAVRRSTCRATGSTLISSGEHGALAKVSYECLIPDAAKAIVPLHFPNDSRITADQLMQEAHVLDAAPAEKRINATMKLVTAADGKTWASPGMGGVLGTVIDGIAGDLTPGARQPSP